MTIVGSPIDSGRRAGRAPNTPASYTSSSSGVTVRLARLTAMFGSPTPTKQTRWPASSRAAATIIISDLENVAVARGPVIAAPRTARSGCRRDPRAGSACHPGPDDVVPERRAGARSARRGVDVVDLDDESVPAAWRGRPAVGHRPGGRRRRTGEPELRSPQADPRERGQHLLLHLEPERSGRTHRPGDIANEIADGAISRSARSRPSRTGAEPGLSDAIRSAPSFSTYAARPSRS